MYVEELAVKMAEALGINYDALLTDYGQRRILGLAYDKYKYNKESIEQVYTPKDILLATLSARPIIQRRIIQEEKIFESDEHEVNFIIGVIKNQIKWAEAEFNDDEFNDLRKVVDL